MPYLRRVRYASPLLAWHEIELAAAAPGWSESYRAASPRLFVPGSRWVEAEQRGVRFVCDALSPLRLTPEVPYRMRQPFAGQRSLVLVFAEGAAEEGDDQGARRPGLRATPHRATRPHLGPAAHWVLARCRAAVDVGVPDRLAFEEALLGLWQGEAGGADGLNDATAERGRVGEGNASMGRGRRLGRVHRTVERARELLASDPAADHTLQEIARAVASSPFHLARRFRIEVGIGLHGYRTRLRLALALQRVAGGERNLSQLALDLGFSSHSHFSASFRAAYGVPPSRVRTNLTAAWAR